ncbi:TetR/AcrR family transcriptional regulator [Lichenihabitans sp. PAMC28606]|uniref:TetR/AcrR family transcriptional regulator n=1 Tax=Lichenihabitans TaxID=2723776 RepID=UPI0010382E07|nr:MULTISPECIES: TetR/AcrR family transcriptional regulator [Lichenihabitans]UDL95879.1 TetR/AcrR family transcriptional regulator [Lichenihabitans sp. PAMC28606]
MDHGNRFFGGERRAYHHGRLKEALVEAARLLVSERGPGGFTLADAAKLAGVTAAAPYRHFSDRNALMEELTRRGFEMFGLKLSEAWADGKPDARSAMNSMGNAYLAFARTEPGLYAAMFSNVTTLNAPEAGAAATEALDLLRRAATALLKHGGAPSTDSRPLAFEIWSLSHGVAMLTLAGHLNPAFEGADPSAILHRSTEALIEAALWRSRGQAAQVK